MSDIVEDALESTREELKEVDREKHLIKSVKMLNDVEASISEKKERFEDWYSLHFPELVGELDTDHLIKILDSSVNRDGLEPFEDMASDSKGSEITEKEEEILEQVRTNLESDLELRESLQNYIEQIMKDEMSNISVLLGPFLGARIVALAGGLEELAKKPASTVQMLGAEKALFRYLRGQGTPPKHGVLFEHEFVNPLPDSERGKMARFMANKTVMAARLDMYGDKEKGRDFREEAREKFEQLEEA